MSDGTGSGTTEQDYIRQIERLTSRLRDRQNALDHAIDYGHRMDARVEALEDKLERINQWCRAYPRTVFIEPTKEQWAEANKVLEAHRPSTPGLTAISGSNMRHVVEGIQALAATEQEGET